MGYIREEIYGFSFVRNIVADNPLAEEVNGDIRYEIQEVNPEATFYGEASPYSLEPKHALCVVTERLNGRGNRFGSLVELTSNEEIEKFMGSYSGSRVSYFKVEKDLVGRLMNRRYRRRRNRNDSARFLRFPNQPS